MLAAIELKLPFAAATKILAIYVLEVHVAVKTVLLCPFRAATDVREQQAAAVAKSNGAKSGGAGEAAAAERELQRSASEARLAVAAKISAARALARKLSEEKQAAVAAARAAAEQTLDEEDIDRCPL